MVKRNSYSGLRVVLRIITISWVIFSGTLWAQPASSQSSGVVKHMELEVRGGQLPAAVHGGLNYYYGRPFLPETAEQLQYSTLDSLEAQGYYQSQVKLASSPHEGGVSLRLDIDLGPICRVVGVKADFTLAADLEDPRGRKCSRRTINDYFSSLSFYYKKNQFLEFSSEKAVYRVSADGREGVIELAGHVGPQVSYEFTVEGLGEYGLSLKQRVRWERRLTKDVSVVDVSPGAVREYVEDLMLQAGHMAQVVKPQVRESSQTKVYHYVVQASEQMKLSQVKVLGVKVFDEQEVDDILRSHNRLGVRQRVTVHSLDERIQELQSAYFSRGYFDMVVDTPEFKRRVDGDGYQVKITVREGLPYVFEAMHFTGARMPADRLLALGHFAKGDVLGEGSLNVFRSRLAEFLAMQGYLENTFDISFDRQMVKNQYQTTIKVQVSEGPRYMVHSVDILGLVKTRRHVVLRELQIKVGDVLTPKRMEASYENLKQLGLFKSIRFEHQDTHEAGDGDTKQIRLLIQLEELSHGLITFGPEYNLLSGYQYMFGGSYNNLFGRGHRIFARLRVDEDRDQEIIDRYTIFASAVSLRYIYPFIAGWPLDFSLIMSRRVTASTFWRYNSLVSEEFIYHLPTSKPTQLKVYTKQSLSREVGTRDQSTYFLTSGESLILASGLELMVDRRDDKFLPTRGYQYKLGYEKAFYAYIFNTRYDKYDLSGEWVKGLNSDITLILGGRYTQLRNIDIRHARPGYKTLPAAELLHAGGVDLVRGFDRLLGPYVRYTSSVDGEDVVRDILGGTDRLIINAKLRFLLMKRLTMNLFYDAGNTFLNQEMLNVYNLRFKDVGQVIASEPVIYDNYPINVFSGDIQDMWRKLYSSAGVAFAYLTPIGHIELSVAQPLYQPRDPRCREVERDFICLDRRRPVHPVIQRLRIDLSVSTRF